MYSWLKSVNRCALIALKFMLLKMAYALLSGLMSWEPLVSKCKSLTIKVRALEPLITPPFFGRRWIIDEDEGDNESSGRRFFGGR